MGRFKTVYWVTVGIAALGIAFTLLAHRNGNGDLGILGRVFTGYVVIWAGLRMYRLGTMIRTIWGRINYFFLAAAFIGYLAGTQQWALGNSIGVALVFLYPAYYTLWFTTKRDKAVDDVLKVIWLWAHCVLEWPVVRNLIHATIWYTIGDLLLLFITYYLVLKAFPKRYRPKEPEWDFDRVKP